MRPRMHQYAEADLPKPTKCALPTCRRKVRIQRCAHVRVSRNYECKDGRTRLRTKKERVLFGFLHRGACADVGGAMTAARMIVNLSGGRSSGRMLRQLLDDGRFVRERDFAVFTNTGSEMPQTLDFLRDIEKRWDVPIVWLEFRPAPERFARVNYETAARNGEPFAAAMLEPPCGAIPMVVKRLCTIKLKVEVCDRWLKSVGIDDPIKALGYRADEPQRKARALARPDEQRFIFPLIENGIYREDVIKWWRQQEFDLALPIEGGQAKHGNCDLCFMKHESVVAELIAECPKRADKWCDLEEKLEQRRNKQDCRFWRGREMKNSGWTKCEPPATPTDRHRQAPDGQWFVHDGRWHRIGIGFKHTTYRKLRDEVLAGTYKAKRRPAATFLDSADATMPCECSD